jgi:hypothetical protein
MRSLPCAVCATVAVLAGGQAMGVDNVLQDRNSTVRVNDATADGMHDWTVSGMNHLSQQWFWFRVGAEAQERPLNALPLTGAFLTDTNPFVDAHADTLSLQYSGLGYTIEPSWTLRGGSIGSARSDIAETITINNNRNEPLHMSFFQYSDFDLRGTAAGDTVRIIGPLRNTADQFEGEFTLSETIVTPPPSHWQAAFFPVILNSLNDGGVTTLNDNAGPLGPGDVTWAFQWDITIAPGDSFIISKDKSIVPAPGAGLLLGLGGLMAVRRRR